MESANSSPIKPQRASVAQSWVEKTIEIMVIKLEGPLREGFSDPPIVEKVFGPLIGGRSAKRIICDLSNVSALGADELGSLVWTFVECEKQALQIRYVVPEGKILDKLMLNKLELILRIFATVDDALESF